MVDMVALVYAFGHTGHNRYLALVAVVVVHQPLGGAVGPERSVVEVFLSVPNSQTSKFLISLLI